jgi:cell shape-determining protein MreD
VAPELTAAGIGPDFLTALAAIWLACTRGRQALLGAAWAGLAADVLSAGRMGIGLGSYLMVAYADGLVGDRGGRWFWHRCLAGSCNVTAMLGLSLLSRSLLGESGLGWRESWAAWLGSSLYTSIISAMGLLALSIDQPWKHNPLSRS